MNKPKNSLVNTNPFLREAKSVEKYLTSSVTSSTLVEGVKINNPNMTESDFSFEFQFLKPNYKKLWD